MRTIAVTDQATVAKVPTRTIHIMIAQNDEGSSGWRAAWIDENCMQVKMASTSALMETMSLRIRASRGGPLAGSCWAACLASEEYAATMVSARKTTTAITGRISSEERLDQASGWPNESTCVGILSGNLPGPAIAKPVTARITANSARLTASRMLRMNRFLPDPTCTAMIPRPMFAFDLIFQLFP